MVPEALFPDGFSYTFYNDGVTPAPEKAVDVLTIVDNSTDETAYLVYCYPYSSSSEETSAVTTSSTPSLSGFVQLDQGKSYSDMNYAIVIAIPEDRYQEDSTWKDYGYQASGIGVRSTGLYSSAYESGDSDLNPSAYIAHVETTETGTQITTPYYSITVPAAEGIVTSVNYEEGTGDQCRHSLSFDIAPHDWDGSFDSLVEGVYSGSVKMVYIYCKAADAEPIYANYGVQATSNTAASDGMEIIAISNASDQVAASGEFETHIEELREEAERYASWINPAE